MTRIASPFATIVAPVRLASLSAPGKLGDIRDVMVKVLKVLLVKMCMADEDVVAFFDLID
jgi:hypothetical protein